MAPDAPEDPLLFTRPGEYEVGGMFLRGIAMHAAANGATQRNIAWLIHYGDLSLFHPGALTQAPPQEQLEALGEVQVLLLPLGAGALTSNDAAELAAMLEPRCILPVPQDAPEDASPSLAGLADALGAGQTQETDLLRVLSLIHI